MPPLTRPCYYTPTESDQYGAFRMGPAHPLNLTQALMIPTMEGAMFGNRIWKPKYLTNNVGHWRTTVSPMSIRIREEAKSLETMDALMESGVAKLDAAPMQTEKLIRLRNLGKFIANSTKTAIAAKKMHLLDTELQLTPDVARQYAICDEIEALLLAERKNAEETIPLVEADSSLGFEPSMLYLTDKRHLEWKLRQIDFVLNVEMKEMREGLDMHMRYLSNVWEGSQW